MENLSEKTGQAVITVVLGVALYIAVKQTAKLSKKVYRRLRPAK